VADAGVGVLDDLRRPAQLLCQPGFELALVPPVHPDLGQPGEVPLERGEQPFGPLSVGHGGRIDAPRQDEAAGVDEEGALAAGDLLAPVIAARPPFSVVLTDWLPRIAALGSGSRPALVRARARSAAAMPSQVPSRRHCRNHQ